MNAKADELTDGDTRVHCHRDNNNSVSDKQMRANEPTKIFISLTPESKFCNRTYRTNVMFSRNNKYA